MTSTGTQSSTGSSDAPGAGRSRRAVHPVRRRMPRAERERQMVAEAERVFAERGYRSGSMDEIAERVGVSKPMLYEYFGSKEGLLVACIRRVRTELREATERAVSATDDPERMMRSGVLAFFAFISAHARSWHMLLHEVLVGAGPAAGEVEAIRRQQTDLIVGLLTARKPDGTDPGRLAAYAQIIVGGCERLALWREQNPGQLTDERATEMVMDLAWRGLARWA